MNHRKIKRDVNTSSSINNARDVIRIIEITIEDVMRLDKTRTREEQIKFEMDGSWNCLLPGSPAAKAAIKELERTDPSHAARLKREMGDDNPLIPR